MLSVKKINKRIEKEFCKKTKDALSDAFLLDEYKKCKSVKKRIASLESVLKKNKVSDDQKKAIIDDFVIELIPPGTKGAIRGNKFNNIVKDFIVGLGLDKKLFVVRFEENCSSHGTSEIPDWYILEKKTKRVMIGMNQLDLWRGGQQLNRGSKYLIDKVPDTETKLVCVVCNDTVVKSNKNKVYKLFDVGFTNNTLCYIKNLENIIREHFVLR